MRFSDKILSQEIERVEGLLADRCSLAAVDVFQAAIWYAADQVVTEAKELAAVDVNTAFRETQGEHGNWGYEAYMKLKQELIFELQFYK